MSGGRGLNKAIPPLERTETEQYRDRANRQSKSHHIDDLPSSPQSNEPISAVLVAGALYAH
jgi:hypothetical protein